jgi:hypothetical protein
VFRFGERESEHNAAVVQLSQLANHIEDIIVRVDQGATEDYFLELVREKYSAVTAAIPSHGDSDFLKAKRSLAKKQQKKSQLPMAVPQVFDESHNRRMLEALIRRSEFIMSLLQSLSKHDKRLYLGGGALRNLVWDYLHGYPRPTQLDDVDVIYFDKLSATKDHDLAIEQGLLSRMRNMVWSVKNQARMHVANSEPPYSSLEDAISKWPETATALAARLTDDGELHLIAPHGLGDLFRLIVTPTPAFRNRLVACRQRCHEKNWGRTWPKLRFFDMEDASKDPRATS